MGISGEEPSKVTRKVRLLGAVGLKWLKSGVSIGRLGRLFLGSQGEGAEVGFVAVIFLGRRSLGSFLRGRPRED